MAETQYSKTYSSFSGVDIVPIFGSNPIGECQGISFTVTREKAPLYTMGSADPRSFSRGKRGIAGSSVFLVLDQSALFESMKDEAFFMAASQEIPSKFTARTLAEVNNVVQESVGDQRGQSVYQWKESAKAWYHDQIPPFDIILSAVNEYGHAARMEIRGVEILNCGSGVSVDDITTDESTTFVARAIIPWNTLAFSDPVTSQGRPYQGDPVKGTVPSVAN